MGWKRPVLLLVLMTWTGSSALADLVVLNSGSTIRGTLANRSEILASPGSVRTIVLRPELPGIDAASIQALSFPRSEVNFVVLEEGRIETTISLTPLAPAAPGRILPQRLWLSITVSGSDYAMADLNQFAFDPAPGAADSWEPIGSGVGFGMEIGVDLPSGFTAGLAWDRLTASRGTDPAGGASLGVSAFLLRAFGSYGIVRSSRGSAHLGVSLGAVIPSVIIDYTSPNLADYRDRVVGVAPAGEVFVAAERQLHPWMGMSLQAGYRRALSNGVPISSLDHRDLDYSGGFLRAGLQFSAPN